MARLRRMSHLRPQSGRDGCGCGHAAILSAAMHPQFLVCDWDACSRFGTLGTHRTFVGWMPISSVGMPNGKSSRSAAGYHKCRSVGRRHSSQTICCARARPKDSFSAPIVPSSERCCHHRRSCLSEQLYLDLGLWLLSQAPQPSPIMLGSSKFRYIRVQNESPQSPWCDAGTADLDLEGGREEDSIYDDEDCGASRPLNPSLLDTHHNDDTQQALLRPQQTQRSRWTRRRRIPLLFRWLTCGRRRRSIAPLEKSDCGTCKKRRRPLRFILKSLAVALMLL